MAKHVVIVGAGFGGLAAARKLAHADVQITLIDRRNHHLFQPLLYQVATGGLSPADIAQPIRRLVRGQQNCRVLLAEVQSVDAKEQTLQTTAGPIRYDWCVLFNRSHPCLLRKRSMGRSCAWAQIDRRCTLHSAPRAAGVRASRT